MSSIGLFRLSNDDVVDWLAEIGMSAYSEAFRTHRTNGEELARVDDEALMQDYHISNIGLDSFLRSLPSFHVMHVPQSAALVGHRIKILRAVDKLKGMDSQRKQREDDEVLLDFFGFYCFCITAAHLRRF